MEIGRGTWHETNNSYSHVAPIDCCCNKSSQHTHMKGLCHLTIFAWWQLVHDTAIWRLIKMYVWDGLKNAYLYQVLTFGIQSTRSLVQKKHSCIHEESPGDCDSLLLSSRQSHSPFTDLSLVCLREFWYELMGIGHHLYCKNIVHVKRKQKKFNSHLEQIEKIANQQNGTNIVSIEWYMRFSAIWFCESIEYNLVQILLFVLVTRPWKWHACSDRILCSS